MTGTFAPHDQRVTVPAPGQLVTVRNRQWVAADVSRGEVASSDPHVLTGSGTATTPQRVLDAVVMRGCAAHPDG